jgi:DNA polymerase III subunit delta
MKNSCVFLLVGDEEFLKEEWLQNTRQKFFNKENTSSIVDFNIFFANEIDDISSVLSIAKTTPFLADKRLIVIRNIELLKPPSNKERLSNYAKAPFLNTTLVLEAGISQRDFLKDKFLSEIAAFSEVVSFKRLYDANLHGWISKRALLRKKRVDSRGIELLQQLKGNNLKAIDEEIEKLSLYIGERPLITGDDVAHIVGGDVISTVYDIIDALARNDKKRALGLSLNFPKKDLGNSIGLFCWNLRLLLRTKECLNERWPAQKIGNSLGLKKFQLDRALNQAGRLNELWLKSAIAELTEFDLQIKTSGFCDNFLGWQMLLVRLLTSL